MNKKVLTSAVLLTLLATACGPTGPGSTPGGRGDATTITIYAGGSSEFAWRKGGLEAEVYKAVEDAYYESTGKNLKFNVQFFPQNMKQNITTGINDGSIDVVISHMGGGDGIDDWIMGNGLYRDLTYDFEDYEYLMDEKYKREMLVFDRELDVFSDACYTRNILHFRDKETNKRYSTKGR